MKDQNLKTIISAKARKSGIAIIFIGLLLTGLSLFIALVFEIDILRLLQSPIALTEDSSAFEAENGAYVTVTTEWLYDTGIYEETTSDGRKSITGYYGLIEFDDGFVVCLLNQKKADGLYDLSYDGKNAVFSGWMQAYSAHHIGVVGEIVRVFRKEYGIELSVDDFSPWMLEAKRDFLLIHRMIALAVVLFILFILFRGFNHLRIALNHRAHKLYKALEKLGDPERLEASFDSRITSGRLLFQSRDLYISPELILDAAKGWVRRTAELMWAYKQTVQHRTNGIPTGKTFGLVMVFKRQEGARGKIYESALKKEYDADNAAAALIEHMPTVIIGFDKHLEQLYSSDYEAFEKACRRHAAASEEEPYGEEPEEDMDIEGTIRDTVDAQMNDPEDGEDEEDL